MKEFFAKISRTTWIIIGVVVVVLLVVIFARSGSKKATTYETVAIERGNLVATVGATGTVRAKQSATLLWQTSGSVGSVNVAVGDRVSRGDVLASLDQQSLNQGIILAQADLVSAQQALDNLMNSDTARAQALRTLDSAQTAYDKAYNYRKGLSGRINITETYLDRGVPKVRTYKGYADAETISDADEKLELAKAQLDDAQRAYDRLKDGVNPDDISAAKARVAAAEATLNQAKIIAQFDGTVTQASPSVGDLVNAGTVAFRVDDLSHILVDVQVSEVDINSVAIGQDATLTFDAILGRKEPYHGKVTEVSQAGDTVQGVVNFTVTIELTDADEFVKPGMTTAVNIVVEEKKDVVLIPNRAVRLVNGERVVYLLVNEQPKQVKISLGSSSDTTSVLVDGDIKVGDQVILNPPSANGGPFGG
ncbi:MAG: efflux RND transporter periplasmic adaptor subunit [Anaerolineales bacterium]